MACVLMPNYAQGDHHKRGEEKENKRG